MKNELLKKYNKVKHIKLILAIIIDLIGNLSYFIPAIGESFDIGWAPISSILIFVLFPNHKILAVGGLAEEVLPFTDIIPTALITWYLEYIRGEEKAKADFEKKYQIKEVFE